MTSKSLKIGSLDFSSNTVYDDDDTNTLNFIHVKWVYKISKINIITVQRKTLMVENIDEFDEFPVIRQYFPYQNFPFN